MFIDTHAHLAAPEYRRELKDVVERARNTGVSRIISIGSGYGIETNTTAVEHTNLFKGMYATVGIHPHEAKSRVADSWDYIRNLVHQGKVVALGEMGLDYFKEYSPREIQIKVLEEQLILAEELKLPIVIHDRDAHEEVYEILRTRSLGNPVGVFHCFSGDPEFAQRCVDLGFYISVPGVITFKKAVQLAQVVESIPLNRILLETDCPFLAPVPYRGKRNEPSYIPIIAKRIAELTGKSVEEIGEITTRNAENLFQLDKLDAAVCDSMLTYEAKGNLYLNITNRCTNNCVYCPKRTGNTLWGLDFDLPVEPSAEEIIERIDDPVHYDEIVFCGLGEPLLRLNAVREVARWLKKQGVRVRVNTDGLANLTHGKDISEEISGIVDTISISLNAHNPETYQRVTRTPHGLEAWNEVKKFIFAMKVAGFEVKASAVRYEGVDIDRCREIAETELGVSFKARG